MRWFSFVAGVQLALPPMEQIQSARRFGNFIAKIIGPTAVGVEVVEMLVQRFGEEPRYDIEIFVVMRGQPARVFLRFFHRATGLGRMPRNVNFAEAQHQKRDSSLHKPARSARCALRSKCREGWCAPETTAAQPA